MATKKTQKFLVMANLTLDTNAEITASSLEEAIEIARTLKIADFVEILGDHNDSSLHISGVFES